MNELLRYIFICLLIFPTLSFQLWIERSRTRLLANAPTIELHGSIRTRSPLVNWFLLEKEIPFIQKSPVPSNHPFGQVPFLKSGDVEVFESGAILLYLADSFGYKCDKIHLPTASPQERALYTKWVVWANSELDGLCFGKGMSGTLLDKPSKALDVLNNILLQREWLVGTSITVADIAVASYLNYVPVFFSSINPTGRQGILRYMKRCAERPYFSEAFGKEHSSLISKKTALWIK